MTVVSLDRKEGIQLIDKIKSFLEKEKIEGKFKVIKDDEVKNGYIVLVYSPNIKGEKNRAKKAVELDEKGKNLIKGKYIRFIIHPA
ncbi:hypothetical protein [Persephonella sp.]